MPCPQYQERLEQVTCYQQLDFQETHMSEMLGELFELFKEMKWRPDHRSETSGPLLWHV